MEMLAGPFAAAAVLLVVAGAPKFWAPADTTRALRALRLPVTRPLVRVLGAAEVATGVAALAAPGRATALAVTAWYAGFAVVVALALRSGRPIESCGCFGKADTPPTRAHLGVVVGAALVSGAVAVRPVGSVLLDQPLAGVPFLLLVGCVAWFALLVMSRLAVLR